MPRRTRITAELLAEVKRRRGSGECWKAICRDMEARGETVGRVTWWRWMRAVDVSKPPTSCDPAGEPCTQT